MRRHASWVNRRPWIGRLADAFEADPVEAARTLSEALYRELRITLDRYGHLMPGNEDEAAGLLDAYLERANTQARLASVQAKSDLTGAKTGAHPSSEHENPAISREVSA